MPEVYLEEMGECPMCGEKEAYIEHEGDKMCQYCQYAPQSSHSSRTKRGKDEWENWQEHRAEQYSGWFGPERIKFVGGFTKPYFSD